MSNTRNTRNTRNAITAALDTNAPTNATCIYRIDANGTGHTALVVTHDKTTGVGVARGQHGNHFAFVADQDATKWVECREALECKAVTHHVDTVVVDGVIWAELGDERGAEFGTWRLDARALATACH